jgi:hypothetical protein
LAINLNMPLNAVINPLSPMRAQHSLSSTWY